MFGSNAMVQVKNGPLDFQPREPFSPLFGAMPTHARRAGAADHQGVPRRGHAPRLPGPAVRRGSQVRHRRQGRRDRRSRASSTAPCTATPTPRSPASPTSAATRTGPARTSTRPTGTCSAAWRGIPTSRRSAVADEWVRQTFSNDPVVVAPVTTMMMSSRQTLVNYMTPLGLAHIMGTDDHYGPAPWVNNLTDRELEPVLLSQGRRHRDRLRSHVRAAATPCRSTSRRCATGSRAAPPWATTACCSSSASRWDDTLSSSGRSIWNELVHRYSLGVDGVQTMRNSWTTVQGRIDAQALHRRRRLPADPALRSALVAGRLPDVLRQRLRQDDAEPDTPPPPAISPSTRASRPPARPT